MSDDVVYSTESDSRPPSEEATRWAMRAFSRHCDGASWAKIGREVSMSGTDVETAFNQLLHHGIMANDETLWALDDAYEEHWPQCPSDCEGPSMRG